MFLSFEKYNKILIINIKIKNINNKNVQFIGLIWGIKKYLSLEIVWYILL